MIESNSSNLKGHCRFSPKAFLCCLLPTYLLITFFVIHYPPLLLDDDDDVKTL